jgi:hypothetical protein
MEREIMMAKKKKIWQKGENINTKKKAIVEGREQWHRGEGVITKEKVRKMA